ncbi:pyridoxal phosphate-dependent transferase [Xylariaceae sp. FL0255]|nr:pyridoxal phosphate-dependent transferase [Xylariaceae sp. FL0255]
MVQSCAASRISATRIHLLPRSGKMTRLAPRRLHQVMSTTKNNPTIPASPTRAAARAHFSGGNNKTMTSTSKERKPINLLRGWPAYDLLPADAIREASQTALSDPRIYMPGLEYGPDPGYQPLREELAGWLQRFYGLRDDDDDDDDESSADNITITGGASQSAACLLQSFTDPARTLAVWMVAPCYFLACQIFDDAGFAGRLRAVPEHEDGEGVDLDALERGMRELEEGQKGKVKGKGREGDGDEEGAAPYKDVGPHRKVYRHVIYCVPTFANPSGRTMTAARRKGLVALARKYDALVICDDVYDMLQWRTQEGYSASSSGSVSTLAASSHLDLDRALLPRLVDLDIALGPSEYDPPGKHFGHVVSNGSFSKLVGPGMRTGWTYSTPDFAFGTAQTGSTKSGGAASQIAATMICELLKKRVAGNTTRQEEECVLDRHIRYVLRPAYAQRHRHLASTIHDVLSPLGITVVDNSLRGQDGVFGGYFIWMNLPTSTTWTGSEPKLWPTAAAIAKRCKTDEDLLIGNGELFAVHGDETAAPFDRAIRLCFAWEEEDKIVDGVRRLGRIIRKMLDEGPEIWESGDKKVKGDVDESK